MFNVGEFVVYKRDVCEIMQIKEINNNLYYVLKPIEDKSLKLSIPIDNQFGYLRSIITKEEALELINNIINVEIIDNNDKLIENIYKELLNSNKINDLITIIKTTYLRNDNRLKNKKKISDKDDYYFNKAEKYLYNELALSLNMQYEEVKKYIFDVVSKIKN